MYCSYPVGFGKGDAKYFADLDTGKEYDNHLVHAT